MLKSLFDGLCAAFGAALFSVLPSFIQQYLSGLSAVQGYLARQAPATDETYRQWIDAAVQNIDASTGLSRLIAFGRNFDPHVAADTLRVFTPGVQFTYDGLYFFLLGVIIGLILSNLIAGILRLIFRRRDRYA
jgi:hypothetical protein